MLYKSIKNIAVMSSSGICGYNPLEKMKISTATAIPFGMRSATMIRSRRVSSRKTIRTASSLAKKSPAKRIAA